MKVPQFLLAVGLVVWGWLWWRGRSRLQPGRGSGGVVVEGEYRDLTPSQRIEERDRTRP